MSCLNFFCFQPELPLFALKLLLSQLVTVRLLFTFSLLSPSSISHLLSSSSSGSLFKQRLRLAMNEIRLHTQRAATHFVLLFVRLFDYIASRASEQKEGELEDVLFDYLSSDLLSHSGPIAVDNSLPVEVHGDGCETCRSAFRSRRFAYLIRSTLYQFAVIHNFIHK
jgi:hypothetical protein